MSLLNSKSDAQTNITPHLSANLKEESQPCLGYFLLFESREIIHNNLCVKIHGRSGAFDSSTP